MSNRQPSRGEKVDQAFPQQAARPLGKGYSEIMQMVMSYAVKGKDGGNPTLSHSLGSFRRIAGLKRLLAGLHPEPLCLIEGYSTPGNAGALAEFLREITGAVAHIETVDLYDLPQLYEILGLPMPGMTYHIADAAHLEKLYADGSVDLVVQDFLLNCVPASRHEPLMTEVSRILKPGGIGVISFTSNESLDRNSALSTDELLARHRITWNPQAYDLDGLEKSNPGGKSLAHLTGKIVYNPATSEFIYIAAIGGRFEFFRSKEEMFSLFERNGLRLLSFDVSSGSDDHGLVCTRYRCLLARESLR